MESRVRGWGWGLGERVEVSGEGVRVEGCRRRARQGRVDPGGLG